MKKFNKKILVSLVILFVFGLFGSIKVFAAGPAVIKLGSSDNFVILSKTGISTTGTTTRTRFL